MRSLLFLAALGWLGAGCDGCEVEKPSDVEDARGVEEAPVVERPTTPAAPLPLQTSASTSAPRGDRPGLPAPSGSAGPDEPRDCKRGEPILPRRLSPRETRDRLGPLSRKVLTAIQGRDYRTLATLVHPVQGLKVQGTPKPFDRATVAGIASDERKVVVMGEEDPLSLREFFQKRVVLEATHIDPPHVTKFDWLAPRPVGFSDDCMHFGSLLFELDWSKPYIHYGVTQHEGELGLRVLLGMSFDDHVVETEQQWYLVAIMAWEEWPYKG